MVKNRPHPRKTGRRRKEGADSSLGQALGLCGLHTLHQLLADFNAFQVTSKRQAELTVLRITNFPDLLVLVSLCAAFLMAY